jgi:hypothetical protein
MSIRDRTNFVGWAKRASIAVSILGTLWGAPAVADSPPHIEIVRSVAIGFCDIADAQPGLATVSVVMRFSDTPTIGAAFRIGSGGGFAGVLVSEDYPDSWYGNVTDGVQVGWRFCRDSRPPFELVRLTYQLDGTSAPCSFLEVLPYPGQSSILAQDCNGDVFPARTSGYMWINWEPSCGHQWCSILATEPTTWGRVKALYR